MSNTLNKIGCSFLALGLPREKEKSDKGFTHIAASTVKEEHN